MCDLKALWPWENYWSPSEAHFLIFKMGIKNINLTGLFEE